MAKGKRSDSKLARYRASVSRRAREFRDANEHSALGFGTAWIVGYGERKEWEFPTIPKLDHKLTYAAAALVASTYVKGSRFKRFSRSVADGLLGAYGYSAGKTGDFGVGAYEEELV